MNRNEREALRAAEWEEKRQEKLESELDERGRHDCAVAVDESGHHAPDYGGRNVYGK